jgi:hypothetical protein
MCAPGYYVQYGTDKLWAGCAKCPQGKFSQRNNAKTCSGTPDTCPSLVLKGVERGEPQHGCMGGWQLQTGVHTAGGQRRPTYTRTAAAGDGCGLPGVPAYLYFDAQVKMWVVANVMGTRPFLLAASSAAFTPDTIVCPAKSHNVHGFSSADGLQLCAAWEASAHGQLTSVSGAYVRASCIWPTPSPTPAPTQTPTHRPTGAPTRDPTPAPPSPAPTPAPPTPVPTPVPTPDACHHITVVGVTFSPAADGEYTKYGWEGKRPAFKKLLVSGTPLYMFYSPQEKMWVVGSSLGGAPYILATKSSASSPTFITTQWYFVQDGAYDPIPKKAMTVFCPTRVPTPVPTPAPTPPTHAPTPAPTAPTPPPTPAPTPSPVALEITATITLSKETVSTFTNQRQHKFLAGVAAAVGVHGSRVEILSWTMAMPVGRSTITEAYVMHVGGVGADICMVCSLQASRSTFGCS